jgi:GTP-binding protein YchF
MSLSIGILGLPNVGKSTIFNALTRAQNAEAANYPFCTIEPNKAVVPVPDPRVDKLASMVTPKKTVYATVDFMDIAGLVKGASKGEGLGNKFLGNVREADALLHVIRCFQDENVVHVDGSVDPVRDIEVIETELILADYQTLENRIEKLKKQARADKAVAAKVPQVETLLAHRKNLRQDGRGSGRHERRRSRRVSPRVRCRRKRP